MIYKITQKVKLKNKSCEIFLREEGNEEWIGRVKTCQRMGGYMRVVLQIFEDVWEVL